MKNLTTLSLITIAILGLNGCGGTPTSTTENESNDTKEIVLGIIDAYSTQVDDKVALAEAIETALESNQAQLEANLLTTAEALTESKNYVDNAYANLQGELANDLNIECQDDQACLETAYASISTPLALSHEEAYTIAQDLRDEEKGLVNDKLVENFTCKEGLIRTVQHYGVEDLFSTANGVETTQASSGILTTSWIQNYPYPITGYDETSNDRIFADTVNNLPSGITQGMFYIGLKSNGSSLQGNDTIKIGDYATVTLMNSQLTDLSSVHSWNNQLVSSTNPTTDIYYQSFSNINLNQSGNAAGTLRDLVQTQNYFDVVVEDDTAVDFITVATCSTPEPIKEIEEVVNKFECNEDEGDLLQITGGTIDAFDPISDATSNVSNDFLTRANPYAVSEYDATSHDKHLLDTLALPTGMTIHKAEFAIGYKALNSSLYANDTITIGKYGTAHSGGRYILYPNGTNTSEPMWNATNISNGEIVRTVDLNTINMSQTGTTVLDWMQGKSEFEVRVEDDTSVDFTQLNLCVSKK